MNKDADAVTVSEKEKNMLSREESNQAVFDTALNHIRKQGVKSYISDRYRCLYRTIGGLMCAFGPCIKDYDITIEGNTADEIVINHNYRLYDWAKNCDPSLACDIQACHDTVYTNECFLDKFEENMQRVAKDYNLVYSEPK